MQRFFIADLHLSENEPVITAGFLHFLQQLPSDAELYILGDLFDYWIGDDILSPLQLKVADALAQLSIRQIKVYFIHGNRDFLLGKAFAKRSNIKLLSEVNSFTINEQAVVILHGDLLCTDDTEYQKFRRKVHNKWLQRLFLLLPKWIRGRIANKLRAKSSQHNQQKSAIIMDVNQQTVEQVMRQYNASIMIHGHTHKPAIHHFQLDNKPVCRAVLAAWHDGVNYLHQDEQGNIEFKLQPFNPPLDYLQTDVKGE